MTIQITIVVNGRCLTVDDARAKFKTLRSIDFLSSPFIKVFAEDIDEAHRIKNNLKDEDFEYMPNKTIHRRKVKQDYRTYWDTERIFIFVDRGDKLNTL